VNTKYPFIDNMLKLEIYNLIKCLRGEPKHYVVDPILIELGDAVLRLPFYHPDLSFIENVIN
jgi:hypothetical protein